jgi:hypothetical protein
MASRGSDRRLLKVYFTLSLSKGITTRRLSVNFDSKLTDRRSARVYERHPGPELVEGPHAVT